MRVLSGNEQSNKSNMLMANARCVTLLTALNAVLLCGHVRAGDPWSPDRKFCGRLSIIIAGAGEAEIPALIDKAGKKQIDILSVHTWANFLQFSRANGADMPAYSIVMTSDPKLKNVLNQMSSSEKQTTGFLGVVPSSIDSFKDLLSSDSKVSILQRAITKFSENRESKELMRQEGCDSVIPLLKVEIVIESENSRNQIPLWSTASETGSLEAWERKENPPALTKELIQQLLKRFDGALIETFVAACSAANIAEAFITPNKSSCSFSITDHETFWYLSGVYAPFGAKLGEEGASQEYGTSLQRKFLGAPNVASMVPRLLTTNFQRYRVGNDLKVGFDPIFAATDRINPLQSFALTSADARAENVLQAFVKEKMGVDSDAAERLLSAGFSESLPPTIQLPPDAATSDPDLRKVLELTAMARKSYAPYLNDITIHPDAEFETAITAFKACARRKNAQPDVCSSIFKLMDLADHGTAEGGKQTDEDQILINSSNDFFDDYVKNYQAPSLIARYNKGEITTSILFERLGFSWKKFDDFRAALTSFESERYAEKSPPDLQAKAAFKVMITNYQDAFSAVQKQFFPILLKGTLEVRLARIEESAKLLHLHKNELPSTLANDELRQLGNELACLTYYPVGPAFDKRNSSQSGSVP